MNDTSYIKSLDGLRAIAIILVMFFHANILHFGWFGVQLFFVLSGFLITGILWKEKTKQEALAYKFKKFWVRRTLRIFPLYFGYLIFLGITYITFHFPNYYATYIPYLATYTFNFTRTLPEWQGNPLFTHLWSLSIEEQFYLVFPFIIFLCPKKFIKVLMIAVVCGGPLIRFFLGLHFKSEGYSTEVAADIVYWNTLSHIDAFFLGGIIPVFALNGRIKNPSILFYIFSAIAILAGIWEFTASHSPNNYFRDLGYNHGMMDHYENVWNYTVLNLVFASFILLLIHKQKYQRLKKIFEMKWLVNIGRVSYGMYIFHWAVIVYLYKLFFWSKNIYIQILMFIPYIALVYAIAWISFRFYESYFIRLKDKIFPPQKIKKELYTTVEAN